MRALSILVLLFVAGTALADEKADRETARREFTAGQASDRKKEYDEAIEHYMRANDLVPHPFAMFNIAVDFEKLGKLREAATWYERYLDNASTKEADREKVNRILIELRNRPSKVSVTSNPDGARVVINGIPTGTTPYNGELKGGMYRVAIEKGDERDFKEITVEYGEPVNVQFALRGAMTSTPAVSTTTNKPSTEIRIRPAPRGASGTLVVRGEPYGALVAVDNVPIGTLPMQVPLEVGTHSVRVTADGFSAYEETVSITASTPTPVDARLSKALGTLTPSGPSLRLGYLLGGGGGADAKGNGTLYLVEAGLRANRYDLSARVGKFDEFTIVDLMARWTLTKTRLAPFIGGGYSYVSNGYGYVFFGGLRFDVVDGEKVGMSLMAESGYRFYSGSPSSDGGSNPVTTSGSIVPIMASLLITYR